MRASQIVIKVVNKKKKKKREFPVSPKVKTQAFTAVDSGSIPGWGTKIPHAACCRQ